MMICEESQKTVHLISRPPANRQDVGVSQSTTCVNAELFDDAQQPGAERDLVMAALRRSRDRSASSLPVEWIEEWFEGEDDENAFIRDREPVKLPW